MLGSVGRPARLPVLAEKVNMKVSKTQKVLKVLQESSVALTLNVIALRAGLTHTEVGKILPKLVKQRNIARESTPGYKKRYLYTYLTHEICRVRSAGHIKYTAILVERRNEMDRIRKLPAFQDNAIVEAIYKDYCQLLEKAYEDAET